MILNRVEILEQNGESEAGGNDDDRYAKTHTSLGIKKFGCRRGSHLGMVDAGGKALWNLIMESLKCQMKGICFVLRRESLKAFAYGGKD